MMKDQAKNLLAARLKELRCERVPDWLHARLLPQVEAEAVTIEAKARQQLTRRIARTITVRTIAAAFLAEASANGEGSKGEATPPLLPTGFSGSREAIH